MPGALLQLVGRGAQDQLITGNPSFTHFRGVYKRHTDFAMEHFRLYFKTSILSYPISGTTTLRTKVERFAQLVNDCYLSITLPDIFSPVSPIANNSIAVGVTILNNVGTVVLASNTNLLVGSYVRFGIGSLLSNNIYKILTTNGSNTFTFATQSIPNSQISSYVSIVAPPGLNPNSNAIPYEFQWVRNIGYNMINSVSVLINGQEIVKHTGEWMKIYANLQFDAHKRAILDKMVGNVPEVFDPANANGRFNQYPTSISTSTDLGQASIPGRVLQIPLHFWFCESIGKALPLVALQYSEVEIVVELNNMYQLFTTIDVNPISLTYGQRVAPDTSSSLFQMTRFLSPPNPASTAPTVSGLTTWNLNPFIEANYIFVADDEMAYLARTDHSFLFRQIDVKASGKQYGASNDLELVMRNLCTRIIWVFQRDDFVNDPDNYTNWKNPYKHPAKQLDPYSTGSILPANVSQRDILLESTIILDTQERFAIKQTEFFNEIQPYRFSQGNPIPGIYSYSFQLDNSDQPSGCLNGSMFNKTILRNTLIQPPFAETNSASGICVLKSTVGNPNPTPINPAAVDSNGKLLYKPEDIIHIVTKSPNTTVYGHTYNVRAYTESYNFLRIIGGMGNVVFSS